MQYRSRYSRVRYLHQDGYTWVSVAGGEWRPVGITMAELRRWHIAGWLIEDTHAGLTTP